MKSCFQYYTGNAIIEQDKIVELKKLHTVCEWHCKEELMVGLLPLPTQSLMHHATKRKITDLKKNH